MKTAAPPRELMKLKESAHVIDEAATTRPDGEPIGVGNVAMHLIRPCVGRGKGRHVYPAEMLAENAHKFTGWRMFVNHLSEQARKAAGGLPRDVRDLGGRVVEAWWDADVPADDRFEQGAVVAEVRPTPYIRELVENDPELLRASISARATSVRPTTHEGKRAWIVEGIEDVGSVDWVTEDGAGGRVVSLLESSYHDQEDIDMALLESLTDDEFIGHLRDSRPQLLEALTAEQGGPARQTQEETNVEFTPEDLREALHSDEGREIIRELVEAELEEQRDIIRAEARADADRQIQLRDFRDAAHGLIEAAELPNRLKAELRGRFTLTENGPSPALNVIDEIDPETGAITKPAAEVLRESVEQEIKNGVDLIGELSPTTVRGQGPGDPERVEESKDNGDQPLWKRELQEAGIDPEKAY